jgi:hypothetical protein
MVMIFEAKVCVTWYISESMDKWIMMSSRCFAQPQQKKQLDIFGFSEAQ